MSHNKAALYHTKRYNAQVACEHCEGIIRQEGWCQTLNPVVCYAYKIVVSGDELAIGDAIILHSLGVLWDHCHI
jgi:glycerol-3-phosphate cytidylyltransferase-like family protein